MTTLTLFKNPKFWAELKWVAENLMDDGAHPVNVVGLWPDEVLEKLEASNRLGWQPQSPDSSGRSPETTGI